MKQSSQGISGVGSSTGSVGNKLSGAAGGAPSYEGQFGPRVRSIADAAASRARELGGRVTNLGGWLNSKTDAFIAVDAASQAGVRSLAVPVSSSGQSSMLLQLSKWLGIPVSLIEKYLKLGGLFGFGSLLSSIAISFILNAHYGPSWQGRTFQGMKASAFVSDAVSRIGNWRAGLGWKSGVEIAADKRRADEEVKRKADEQAKRKVQEEEKRKEDAKRNAEEKVRDYDKIKADVASGKPYQSSNGIVNSSINKYTDQCTAYVAFRRQDIVAAKHGKYWLGDHKAAFETGTEPRAGAILVQGETKDNSYGHVAYVERVNPDGTIVVSEQNYPTGSPPTIRTINPKDRPSIIGYIYGKK